MNKVDTQPTSHVEPTETKLTLPNSFEKLYRAEDEVGHTVEQELSLIDNRFIDSTEGTLSDSSRLTAALAPLLHPITEAFSNDSALSEFFS